MSCQEGGGSDSEEENEKLQELESALRQHSPEFLGDTTASKPTSVAENYQIQLSTEQVWKQQVHYISKSRKYDA